MIADRGRPWRWDGLHDNDVVPSRAEGCPVSILERPWCSEVHRRLVAVGKRIRRASLDEVRSSRWPPRRRTIIPRRPESLSIQLNAPFAFIATRSVAVTVIGTGRLRRCTLLGHAAGRRRSGCWGFGRKPVDSRGRSEGHRRDLEVAGGSLSSGLGAGWRRAG